MQICDKDDVTLGTCFMIIYLKYFVVYVAVSEEESDVHTLVFRGTLYSITYTGTYLTGR